jgi:hypothetical protein
VFAKVYYDMAGRQFAVNNIFWLLLVFIMAFM